MGIIGQMKNKFLLGILVGSTMMTASVAYADTATTSNKWGSHIDLEGKAGTDRNLGETDLFIPLLQNDDTLFFTNMRARMDDQSSREGNFGLGLRHMLKSGWNLGGIAYFDRRETEWGNYFNQVTLGVEALSTDWDFRANAYLPQGRRSHEVDALNEATITGTSVMFTAGEERSMSGFDAEVGWRVPVYEPEGPKQFRLFAGGYRFTGDNVDDITGPRLRGELAFDEVPWLWEGSRFSFGTEWQHDDPRGSQGFVTARLRIPLQIFGGTSSRSLTPMERRMTDPVIRDIDVVSQAGAFGATEVATETADGEALTVLDSASTTTVADLNTALTNAGSTTVILSGTFSTNAAIVVANGQTLVGGGTMTVKSPSGKTATLLVPGATIAAQDTATSSTVVMADNSTLRNMTVTNYRNGAGNAYAVNLQNKTGVTIENSTITSYGNSGTGFGIDAYNSTNAVIRGNTVTASSSAANAIGMRAQDATNITIADNSISLPTAGAVKYVLQGNNGTSFNATSTGNTASSGTCNFFTPPTGSVGFGSINCP